MRVISCHNYYKLQMSNDIIKSQRGFNVHNRYMLIGGTTSGSKYMVYFSFVEHDFDQQLVH
jgi:hypothetical protein